ncbi:MAG: hypothetical protein ABFC34_04800 [Methanobacterium sp.]
MKTFNQAKLELENSEYGKYFELVEFDPEPRYGKSKYRDKEYGDVFIATQRKLLKGHYPNSIRSKVEKSVANYYKQKEALEKRFPYFLLVRFVECASPDNLIYDREYNELFAARITKIMEGVKKGGPKRCDALYNTEEYKKQHGLRIQETIKKKKEQDPNWQEKVNKKREETCKEKYGLPFVAQVDEFKEKAQQKLIEIYGVDHPMKSELLKNKMIETNKMNNGGVHNLSSEDFKEYSKQKCLEEHGVEYWSQAEEIKDRRNKVFEGKYEGGWPTKDPRVQQKTVNTNQERYGADRPAQSSEILEKQMNTVRAKEGTHLFKGKLASEIARVKGMTAGAILRLKKGGLTDEQILNWTKNQSTLEILVKNYIHDDLKITNIVSDKRYFTESKYRPDIVLPDHGLIIECDGLLWHSDHPIYGKKSRSYHQTKQLFYKSQKYKSLFFREDELTQKFDIVKSIIKNTLGLNIYINSSVCIIKTIAKREEGVQFLHLNHLKGPGSLHGDQIGLYFNDELVSVIRFTLDKNNKSIRIHRFCNKNGYNVSGSLDKILKYLNNNYPDINYVEFYVDERYDCLNLENLGFTRIPKGSRIHELSFVWTDTQKVFPRKKFLGNSGYDQGLYRIYDCGQSHYKKYFQ